MYKAAKPVSGVRNFAEEAEKETDAGLQSVMDRLNRLVAVGGLPEKAVKLISTQLYHYGNEVRKRKRDKEEDAKASAPSPARRKGKR